MSVMRVITSRPDLKEKFADSDLKVTGGAGDTRLEWDPNSKKDVENARKTFDALVKGKTTGMKFNAFKTTEGEKEGERVDKFDPKMGSVTLVPSFGGG